MLKTFLINTSSFSKIKTIHNQKSHGSKYYIVIILSISMQGI